MVGMFERPGLYGLVILFFYSWVWPFCHFDIAWSSWSVLAVFNSHYTLLKTVCFIFQYNVRIECSLREAFLYYLKFFLRANYQLLCSQINTSYALMFFVLLMLVSKNLSDLRRERNQETTEFAETVWCTPCNRLFRWNQETTEELYMFVGDLWL